jgi:hypothetical protein
MKRTALQRKTPTMNIFLGLWACFIVWLITKNLVEYSKWLVSENIKREKKRIKAQNALKSS